MGVNVFISGHGLEQWWWDRAGNRHEVDDLGAAITELRKEYGEPAERLALVSGKEKSELRHLREGVAAKLAVILRHKPCELGPFGGLPGLAGSATFPFADGSEITLDNFGRDGWGGSVKGLPTSQAAGLLAEHGFAWPCSNNEIRLLAEQAWFDQAMLGNEAPRYTHEVDRWAKGWMPTDEYVLGIARRAVRAGGGDCQDRWQPQPGHHDFIDSLRHIA